MRRSVVVLVALLAGCSGGWSYTDDRGVTVTEADVDAALEPVAHLAEGDIRDAHQGVCEVAERSGRTAALNSWTDALTARGASEDEAIRSGSALLIRYCPDVD